MLQAQRCLWLCKSSVGSSNTAAAVSRLMSSCHHVQSRKNQEHWRQPHVINRTKLPKVLSTSDQPMTLPFNLISPGVATTSLQLSQSAPVEKEYQCPSRLLEHFSQLVILDTVVDKTPLYDCPMSSGLGNPLIAPNVHDMEIIEPPPTNSTNNSPDKLAKHILIIRHKKMKKHKRKKLAKKMRFVWAKFRMRRRARKAKRYKKMILAIRKTGTDFDAREFVENQLIKARKGGYSVNVFETNSGTASL